MVIDANMMVSDVLARRRHEGHPSNNERLVTAGLLRLHIPSGAIIEMETRALPKVAKKKKIPITELLAEWRAYQAALTVHVGYDVSRRQIIGMSDPDDEIYVQLMEDIGALGVLTHDRHFEFLELKALNNDVLKDIQSYTIALSNGLNLQFAGIFGVSLSGKGLLDTATALVGLWKRAPVALQIALLGAVCFAVWHDWSREKIYTATNRVTKLAPTVFNGISAYVSMIGVESGKAEELRQSITGGRLTNVG